MSEIDYPRPPLPEIDTSTYRLPAVEYVAETVNKTGIVLHHTVSRSVQSVYDWWLQKPARVGTAYVISQSGDIFEFFPDNAWAWHLGKSVSREDEARTIGIELVSEGGLVPSGGELLAFHNPKTGQGMIFHEEFVDLGRTWRGYRYFDSYSNAQIQACIILVDYLCDKYDIRRRVHSDLWEYDESIRTFEGIMTHAQVRLDKTDVHPMFPIKDVAKWTKLEML